MISIITPALVKDGHSYQWLHECIASVRAQPGEWEHIVVDDHSRVNLDALKKAWPHVRWLEAEGQGVSMARNQAADHARGDLLLPVDADDKLASGALDSFRKAWAQRGDAGIVYSDVVMFGEDYAQVYLAAEYDFRTLLKATFMTVGSLHRKADWDRVGGWRLDMTQGLEDWEYWIALGELGVCGKHWPEPLYWYRRHPRGRLQWLRQNTDLWDRAYNAMRELHIDSYNGRFPMGCCGGARRAPARKPAARPAPAAAALPRQEAGMVNLAYYGPRQGDFQVVGGVTRTRYRVPGRGQIVEVVGTGTQGVKPADVAWFRSANGGRDFRPLESAVSQKAPAPPVPAQPPATELQDVEVEKYEPEVMEPEAAPEPAPVPDIQEMTVAEIRGMDFSPDMAAALLGQEEAGKGRVTVINHLRGLLDAAAD